MATAEIKVKSSLDSSGFTAGINSMRQSAMSLKGVMAGAFSIGAVGAFAKASLDYAAQFQDMADQFGISASSASAFSKALQNVGGSAEKASAIMSRLSEKQQSSNMSMEQYIQSVMSAYEATGDYASIVDAVGAKNAPAFIAAMREMGFSLEEYKKTALGVVSDVDAAMADFYGEKMKGYYDTALAYGAKYSVKAIENAKAVIADIKGLFAGKAFGEGYNEYMNRFDLEATVKEGEAIARDLAIKNARRERAGENGDVMTGGFDTLRSMMASIIGSAGGLSGTAAQLSAASKIKQQEEQAVGETRRYDELRRIGGGLMPGGQDPVRVQEQTRDEIKAVRKGIDELVRNSRGTKGSVF